VIWGFLSGGILLCPWGISSFRKSGSKNDTGLQKEISESSDVRELEEASTEDVISENAKTEAETTEELVVDKVDRGNSAAEELIFEEEVPREEIAEDEVSGEANEEVVREEVTEDVAIEEVVKEETITEKVIVEEETAEVMIIGEEAEVEAYKEIACSDEEEPEVKGLSLAEIIDKGFQAKEDGQFHLATEWFIAALELKPDPDVAFYLIIESYWHWKKCYSAEDAWSKLSGYITEFMVSSTPEWRQKLRTWIKTENILTDSTN
jgi:hypothetical protein